MCKIKTVNAQNNFLHYIGKVLKVEPEESIEIQFYRQSMTVQDDTHDSPR